MHHSMDVRKHCDSDICVILLPRQMPAITFHRPLCLPMPYKCNTRICTAQMVATICGHPRPADSDWQRKDVQTYRLSLAMLSNRAYLRQLTPVTDIPSRQILRSSSSDDRLIPAVRLPTIVRRAFLVTGARTWNDLPVNVTSAPYLHTFRKRLNCICFDFYSLINPSLINCCYSVWSLR